MESSGFMTVLREPTVSAVAVSNGYKRYSTKPGTKPIINNLTMNVPRGKIYSLLGSSGCGKTTLLSCVIGTRRLDAGDILVFGKTPGDPDSGVPGRRLGFMPQEIALHGEFSISEELHYFGKIFGMSTSDVEDNKKFLINFLKLPPGERRINSLSGGQQRRVSFASALVHNPELLILDEPTVGVDPLLRQSIWSHLVRLASTCGTSIIITTHFIEEARDSHRIGLMRNGRILMEESPATLMKKYQTNILEEIVVELCLKDKSEEDTERDSESADDESVRDGPQQLIVKKSSSFLTTPPENQSSSNGVVLSASSLSLSNVTVSRNDSPNSEPLQAPFTRWPSLGQMLHKATQIQQPEKLETNSEKFARNRKAKFDRISALLHKNILGLTRNLLFVFFLLGLPAFQVVTVCLAIGPEPNGLSFGLINYETGLGRNCNFSKEVGCMMSAASKYNTLASCEFIKVLKPETFELVEYNLEAEAIQDVKLGKLLGFLTFPPNFTEQLKDRLQYGPFAGLDVLLKSRIVVTADMSSKLVGLLMQKSLLESFQAFMKAAAVRCKFETEAVDLPIYIGPPVYGSLMETTFTEYIAPGCMVAILYFFTMCSAAMAMVIEKASGTLERSLVAGVQSQEILISHFLTQFALLFAQTLLAFFIVFLFFEIQIHGSLLFSFTLVILIGIVGITFGFLIAAICRTELESVLMTISAFMPNLILSGVVWPLEAMPRYLRLFAYFLPSTIPSASLRSLINRGVPLLHPTVWPGFLSALGYILLCWCTALLITTRKNKH